ncbi:MAG: hypothetical protein NVSMB9_02420 [Isosphaeraceae bacterium]
MSEASRARARACRGAAPWGLVGMVALVILGEWSFKRCELDVIAPWHWDWRHTGEAAKSRAARAEVLCFGDSLLKFSVLPRVIEARAGRRTYNLAVALGQPASSYFLLRRALRGGARPRALLFDATPHMLRRGPHELPHLRQWPELLEPREMLDLAWTARDLDLLVEVAIARLLPSLRARPEIHSAVLSALKGETTLRSRRELAVLFWRNTRVNLGANAMTGGGTNVDFAEVRRALYPSFDCHPINAVYLDRFLGLAASRDIPVFWVIAPFATELQKLCDASGFDAAQTTFIREYQRRYPNLRVLDGRQSSYGQELYTQDPVHMNHVGASVFSGDVAPVLVRFLAGETVPRWVLLPPYRARPEEVPIEDIGESVLAIQNRGTVQK